MLDILICTPDGKQLRRRLELGRTTFGRAFGSDVRIADKSLERHHAVIELNPHKQEISAVNPDKPLRRDQQHVVVSDSLHVGDRFMLGNCELVIESSLIGHVAQARATECSESIQKTDDEPATLAGADHGCAAESSTAEPEAAGDYAAYAALTGVRRAIQEQVQLQLDLYKRNQISDMSSQELRLEALGMARRVVKQGKIAIPSGVNSDQLIDEVVAEAIGLGPVEPLLADDTISEVMVNGPEQVYIERNGRLERSHVRFINDRSLMSVIERIVTPLGRRIDEGMPMVDARLADGSRVNAIIAPLSLTGPVLTIRKFAKKRFDMTRLVEMGTLNEDMAEFLQTCVRHRRNIVISGGTGSGKTTFLNALSDFIPATERIVTIEDAAELRLTQQHVISLEARPPNVEGKGQIAIRDLVRNSLRMRPDRIVVGECRGGEALDMLQAMNTGHDGSLTTGHANSPRDLLSRLEVMVLMSGMELPVRAIREQIASAVDIIVQQTRFSDGRRRITDIVEIDGMEGDVILLENLFRFQQTGISSDGSVLGDFVAASCPPRFYRELEQAGVALNRSAFSTSVEAVA